jgi:hypothetical protein
MASMTLKTAHLPLTLLLNLSLLAACSGDDGDSDSGGGTGGSSSNSGSGGSASGGKAGSSSAGANSGGKASAGSNNGGSGNSTGGVSFAGFGGFNPDDYMCDPVPEAGSNCAADAQPCLNGTEVCGCQEGMWQCIDLGGGEGGGPGGGFGEIECPATQPMNSTPCGDTIGFCPYGGQNMGCVCANGNWMCT